MAIRKSKVSRRSKKSRRQSGGSVASDLVMAELSQPSSGGVFNPAPEASPDAFGSVNLYQTTGGGRRRSAKKSSRKSKSRKSRRSVSRKSRRSVSRKSRQSVSRKSRRSVSRKSRQNKLIGGGSDWIASQYSLGPINNPPMSPELVGGFSQSTATPVDILRNPPNLLKAGSGYVEDGAASYPFI